MRRNYLNFANHRFNKRQETSRERKEIHINTTTLNTNKYIFHYSILKADRKPDKMLKFYSEQSNQHF